MSLMKLAFDHQIFTNQTYGGISRYYTILAEELFRQQQDVKIFAGFHRNQYLSEHAVGLTKGKKIDKYPPNSGRIFQGINHAISQTLMKSWRPDIIHETYYSGLPTFKTNAVRVTTVYDMIHELFAEQFSKSDNTTLWKKATFQRVDHIISISHSTKRDLVELFDIDERKISVVHLGVDLTVFKKNRSMFSCSDRPFILYVGGRDGYKNFTFFLNAFAASVNLMSELDVIAFGGGRFSAIEKQLIKKLGFKDNQVRQIGGSDDVLASLYHNAMAFIYPSLYEGFGLPPLEAMASGCPVISSNTSSIPEVVRESGVYFDPRNIAEIQHAIEKVVFSDTLKKDLISSGYKNIENFSWQKCTSETLSLYRKLSGKV